LKGKQNVDCAQSETWLCVDSRKALLLNRKINIFWSADLCNEYEVFPQGLTSKIDNILDLLLERSGQPLTPLEQNTSENCDCQRLTLIQDRPSGVLGSKYTYFT
jgi:hypothetical protein